MNAGTFRSDLYFRIAQLRVELPALRDRLDDIPALVRRMSSDLGAPDAYDRIPTDSLERLMHHDWPGNVRELLSRFERDYFTALHAECGGNVSAIGRRAAMERAHVRGYLRRHGIGD